MSMVLHCGAAGATRDQVFDVKTPYPTETHYPIPHGALIETVEKHLKMNHLEAQNGGQWALQHDGNTMFGLLDVGHFHDDYRLVIGLRNSHTKLFTAGMAVGTDVFVCDNKAFSAEIVIARKHTRWIMRDLDRMVSEASGRIQQAQINQDHRIEVYKETPLVDADVHDLVVRAVDCKVMANSYIPKVLEEWRKPKHPEFRERTVWSLLNSFTETFKGRNPQDLIPKTTRLHGILDQETCLAIAG